MCAKVHEKFLRMEIWNHSLLREISLKEKFSITSVLQMKLSFIFIEPIIQVDMFHLRTSKLSVIKIVAAIALGPGVEESDIPEPGRTEII